MKRGAKWSEERKENFRKIMAAKRAYASLRSEVVPPSKEETIPVRKATLILLLSETIAHILGD